MIILGAAAAVVIAVVLISCFVCFHSWQDATCESPMTCEKCGKTRGEPLGHAVKKWTVTKETSCSAEGERAGYCERCKKDCTEAIEKLPHTESDWTVEKDYVINSDASVTPGTEAIVCTVCNEQIKPANIRLSLPTARRTRLLPHTKK